MKLNADQLPVYQDKTGVQWNCDEYIIHYCPISKTLTIEEFFGFDDETGEEDCEVITDEKRVSDILCNYNPFLMFKGQFFALVAYLELPGKRGQWKIGQESR